MSRSGIPIRFFLFLLTAFTLWQIAYYFEEPDSRSNIRNKYDEKGWRPYREGEIESAASFVQDNRELLRHPFSLSLLGWSLANSNASAAKYYTTRAMELAPANIDNVQLALHLACITNDAVYAAQSLESMYKANPLLLGGYSNETECHLDENDRDHGTEQVEMLLEDRPQLRTLVFRDSEVFRWLSCRFAGEITGGRVYWVPDKPRILPDGLTACHFTRYGRPPFKIWVSNDKDCDEVLAGAVFELLNLEAFCEAFEKQKLDHKIKNTPEANLRAVMLTEHKALLRLKAFFSSKVLSGALPKHVSIRPWRLNLAIDSQLFLEQMENSPVYINYLRRHFGQYFTNQATPSIKIDFGFGTETLEIPLDR